ncbi:MAG: glycine cleavage system protein GcvH [Bacteriovoracaceae bacterium]|nr:glycine cleavage system protein GcvH [Bacteriovoracaceae bacterium]
MATAIPNDLKYTKEHDWILVEGETITLGITDFAQSALGDIVFVELPEVGASIDKDEPFGVVESIKSVTDLISPFTGTISESNKGLEDSPEDLNADPYGKWMIKAKLTDSTQLSELMSADQYKEFCENFSA